MGFRMFQKQSLLYAFIHLSAFICGYALGYALFEKNSFGLLTAWWLSLYIGFIVHIGLRPVALITILFVAALAADLLFDRGWFYADGASTNPIGYFFISFAYGVIFLITPIFINALVRYFLARYLDDKAQQIITEDALRRSAELKR